MSRRFYLTLVALLIALPGAAKAQEWPQRTVRIIVPFPAGGSNDTLCRIVADKLSGAWKQPVIVDNKAGAGGNIGAEIVYGAGRRRLHPAVQPARPALDQPQSLQDAALRLAKFVPVTVLALTPNVITARKDLPANSAQELIAYAKANPGKVTYASQGNGSTSHLSAQMLATRPGSTWCTYPTRARARR